MAISPDASYDPFAEWYDDWLGDGASLGGDPFALPLLELVGPVAGQRICDLACGQGRVSRHLADQGATVVGIDASSKMLDIASTYPKPASITYRCDDAHTLATCGDAEFDGVLCNMALMDIADLDATFTSAARVLRPGGWLGFSVFHPCFNTPLSADIVDDTGRSHRTVTGYFTEGYWRSDQRYGPPGKIGAYHRTLATFLNGLTRAGFDLAKVIEIPAMTASWREVPPVLAALATTTRPRTAP